MNSYENKTAANWTLADECAGLEKEEGISIETCPVKVAGKDEKATADACQDYMAVLFAGWYLMDGGRKLYEVDDLLKCAIFERSYFHTLSRSKQQFYRKEYGRFCVIVPDYFYDWVNIWKYKLQASPLAQLWIDEQGSNYRIDTNRGKGYMLTRIGQDKDLGTTADYWLLDKDDVALKTAVDRFAESIGKAMDSLPTVKKEKRGPGRPPKEEEPKEGTPEYIAKERDKVMVYYKEVLEKRYSAFAGYERDRIITRIKEKKQADAVTMNDLQRTGSLVPMVNGLYDLKTGKFRSARPNDYISAYAPTRYDPKVKDENVERFLNQFTCDRADLRDFLAQVLGVGLDLNMLTRTMCELWGESTTNGKSTLVKALVACLGKGDRHGLSCELPPTVIGMSASSNDDSRITPSLGMIGASRIMFASEPKAGMKVDWALVKRLTGGDVITVNEKFEKAYNIDARATLVMDTNHALKVDDHTLFARGTIQVVPCDFQITEDIKDKEMDAKLSTESAKSTIMNFMLEGYRSYVKKGKQFTNPPCVQAALAKNKKQSDRIGCFMDDNYITGQPATKKVTLQQLWEEYVEWCRDNGYQHAEVKSSFCRYFESKPQTYTVGTFHNQKALCGVTKVQTISGQPSFPLLRVPVITGDPVDWYVQNFMAKNREDGDNEDVPLAKVHSDYVEKTEAAGGQTVDFWAFFGTLIGKGWNISMVEPGVASSVMVTGWHIKTEKDREQERREKLEVEKNKLDKSVSKALENIQSKDNKMYKILCILTKASGINKVLDGMEPEVREAILEKNMTGGTWDNVLAGVVAKRV